MNTPAARLQDRDWRLRNSLWIVGTLCCCGLLTWASFLYVGIRAKSRPWLLASAAYGVLLVGAIAASSMTPRDPDGAIKTGTWQGNVLAVLLVSAWLGGFVHALLINRQWLRIRAADVQKWYEPGPPTQSQPSATNFAGGFGVDTSEFYAPGIAPPATGSQPPPPTPRVGTVGPTQPAPPQQRTPPPHPSIEVNTAGLAEFLQVGGLDAATAERIIVERARRGGFDSIEEFVTAAHMPPHVYAAMRHRFVLAAAAPGGQGDGAGNTPPKPAGSGRVLDL